MPVEAPVERRPSPTGETAVRGRAGFRSYELNTIPANIPENTLKASEQAAGQKIQVLSNYIRIRPMKDRYIYSYRVDFEPQLDSVSLRKRLLRHATKELFAEDLVFDGMSDARTSSMTEQVVTELNIDHPSEPDINYKITLKRTGIVPLDSNEMLRVYGMNMKKCFEALGFFQVSTTGSYVHPALATPIGSSNTIFACRGYKTAFNMHDTGELMMKIEPCHKLMQRNNVLQYMSDIRKMGGNPRENLTSLLVGKLVVTSYNKIVYKVEELNFDLTPKHGFTDKKTGKEVSYMEYFKIRYNVDILEANQPMLRVIPNNKRRQAEQQGQTKDIYVVPELCNMAGLTDAQRNDNRLKTDLIRSSQINPNERVKHMETFIEKLNNHGVVTQILNKWGYQYDTQAAKLTARLMPMESIGLGRVANDRKNWPKADPVTGSFEPKIMRESVAEAPEIPRLAIILPRVNCDLRDKVLDNLRQGMKKIGLQVTGKPKIFDLQNESAQQYVNIIRNIPADATCIIAVMNRQNKECYDAIKKSASVERGLITQVATTTLLTNDRKSSGASVKIGIQIAAKIGGEPWYINIPCGGDMICGYDTYHDTTDRSRSYGAFIASTNDKFSRWFSKADSHSRLDELSSHMATNLVAALTRFRELNGGKYPRRIFIYRDGVSDGQLDHVFNIELKQVLKAIDELEMPQVEGQPQAKPRLTFTIVNKKTGAQFYMRAANRFENPTPGSVIDNTVTKKGRYDFYLISQSTHQGTVSPTYYSIIHDESNLGPDKHQMLAYKLCFLYYNWAGTIKVPAPCQYAHKLALLCGEHLHGIPSTTLDDRLHFL